MMPITMAHANAYGMSAGFMLLTDAYDKDDTALCHMDDAG